MNIQQDDQDDLVNSTQSRENDLFESSLDSYSKLFDRNEQNFTTSSEIPLITKEILSPYSHNRTFTKEKTTTMINAFTGKPISPNPWRKLSTKNIQKSIVIHFHRSIKRQKKKKHHQHPFRNGSPTLITM